MRRSGRQNLESRIISTDVTGWAPESVTMEAGRDWCEIFASGDDGL
jgi:hypothetical protein